MNLATILPKPYLSLVRRESYQMALAHIAARDLEYRNWFRDRADEGAHVILDNGAAELGKGISTEQLAEVADAMQPTEVVLPDVLAKTSQTLRVGAQALETLGHRDFDLMAVPQGSSIAEWLECLDVMLEWPIDAIGVSRFVVNHKLVKHRAELLECAEQLIDSNVDIHLLGCPGDPWELFDVELAFPGRIRGADSGIAAIYAQDGTLLGEGSQKPDVALNFLDDVIESRALLLHNIRAWKSRARYGQWPIA